MKDAHEMFEWYVQNRVTNRMTITDIFSFSYFEQIEKELSQDEYVKSIFVVSNGEIGRYFYNPFVFLGEIAILAVTNKSIILGTQKGFVLKTKEIKRVQINYLNDVSKKDRIFTSTIVIDTIKEVITVSLRKKDAEKIYQIIKEDILNNKQNVNEQNI